MKHRMDLPRVRKFQSVCLSPNFLQNFVKAIKLPLQLMCNALQSQVLGTQQDLIPNGKLYIPVLLVIVALLYCYSLLPLAYVYNPRPPMSSAKTSTTFPHLSTRLTLTTRQVVPGDIHTSSKKGCTQYS